MEYIGITYWVSILLSIIMFLMVLAYQFIRGWNNFGSTSQHWFLTIVGINVVIWIWYFRIYGLTDFENTIIYSAPLITSIILLLYSLKKLKGVRAL